ncbi:MAG: phytoene desaturase family protein, partial [Candidatus Hodarchaeota archaeon]
KVRITLLEQNDIIGGRCGSYYIYDDENHKFKMDVGCHIFNTADNGPLGHILRAINRPDAVKWEHVTNPGPRFAYRGQFFKFPKEAYKVGIKRKTVNEMIALMMQIYSIKPEEIPKLDDISILSYLDQNTKNQLAKALFSVQAGACFGLFPQEVSAGEYVRMIQANIKARSLGYCRGGTGAIPEAYVDRIKDAGGKIITGDDGRVSKIVVENNIAVGVEYGQGKNYIPADIIIANSDIKSTVLKLVGENYFENDYISYVKDLIWGGRGCSLKVVLNKKLTNYKMINYLPPWYLEERGDEFSILDQSTIDDIQKGIMPEQTGLLVNVTSNFDPGLCPEGFQIIHTCTLTLGSEASPELERKFQKVCLRSLVDLFPEIEDSIVIEEFVSNSYLREKMGKEGSATGIGQCMGQVGAKRPSQIAPIKNLYFSSCDAGGYGVGTELAAQSALELFDYMKNNKIIEFF